MAFLPACSISSTTDQTRLVELVMKEYITFPVLLSNKNFPKVMFWILSLTFETQNNKILWLEMRFSP